MKIFDTKLFKALAIIAVTVLLGLPLLADAPADPSAASDASATAAAALPDAPSQVSGSTDDSWRFLVSIYGWFPGIHGNAGLVNHNVSIHAPFSDVFHYLKGVIPIAFEADKGRFVMPLDFFWVKLGDDRAIPLNDFGQTSADLHITESIFTPKVGYRIIDGEHMKVDALIGLRYWHLSQDFTLVPSQVSRSQSVNWVDGLGGGRFIFPLGDKARVQIAGDAGGGGAHLDYQAVGLFMYNLTPKLGMGLGWRYLDVNYYNNNGFLYDVAQTGALAGMYLNFGGKPPVPPAASCSVSPAQVMAGEPVKASISTQNFKPKHPLSYKWSAPGAKISGSGDTATVDTAGLAPGRYTVTGTATDDKEKKNNSASCNATFAVMQPPRPPVASCSANPSTVKAGDPATVSVNASSPDGAALTYAYSTTGGTISGSGSTATLDTASAQPGSTVTTTATVTDSRGLSTTCNAMVNVLSPPVTVQEVQEVAECKFKNPKKPWRVDNECKAVLDDVALRIQREPNGKFVVVGYANEEETVKVTQLGAQRAVNVKYYLVEGEGKTGVDPARLEPRTGVVKEQSVKIYYVPSGATFKEESVVIDETQVKGQSRNAPAPRKKAKPATTPTTQGQ